MFQQSWTRLLSVALSKIKISVLEMCANEIIPNLIFRNIEFHEPKILHVPVVSRNRTYTQTNAYLFIPALLFTAYKKI